MATPSRCWTTLRPSTSPACRGRRPGEGTGRSANDRGRTFQPSSSSSASRQGATKRERYGREVCVVYVSLRDVGLEQIRQGMAWHNKAYQHERPTQERLVIEMRGCGQGSETGTMEGCEASPAVGVQNEARRREVRRNADTGSTRRQPRMAITRAEWG